MTTIQLTPTAAGDDGFWREDTSAFGTTGAFSTGNYSGLGSINGFVRFADALSELPAGATIAAASLALVAYTSQSGTVCRLRIRAVAADDPAAPTTYAEVEGAPRTTASTTWEPPATTADLGYNSPDFAAVVQEIVDRPGWAAGQHLLIYIEDDGSDSSARRQWHAQDTGFAPVLTVEFEVAPPPPPPPSAGALAWHVYVDWDGDGNFEADEGARLLDLSVERGRERLLESGRIAPMGVGQARLVLDNHDGRYDAWNTSSPLYPNVLPLREVWVQVTDGVTTWDVMRGTGQEVVAYGYDEPRAELAVRDGWQWLQAQTVERAVSANAATGAAINAVLDVAGWPWARDVDGGSDTIPYWWAHGDAAGQVNDLSAAEFGFAYVTAGGAFAFRERHAQYGQAPGLTVTQADLLREPELGQPSELVRNRVRVTAQPRSPGGTVDVWKLGEELAIPVAGTEILNAELSEPAMNLIAPVAGTDFIVTNQPGGAGLDITHLFPLQMTAYARTIRLQIGNISKYTGYVSLLKVRGQELTGERLNVTADDTTSQAAYGVRTLEVDYPWIQSTLRARNEAEWLLSWLAAPSPQPRVEIESRPALQFGHDLGTILNLDIGRVGLYAAFRIGKIRHEWRHPGGQAVRTRWWLEPVRLADYWVLGTSTLGQTTRLGF